MTTNKTRKRTSEDEREGNFKAKKRKDRIEEQQIEEMKKWMPPKELVVTVKDGLRFLSPYWTTFRGYSKRRWVGRTVEDVFGKEFVSIHPLYPKAAIRKGRIFVNKNPLANGDYKIRDNDFFVHIIHRHENEVPNLPIQIIAETDDVLVLNKPGGLPVHPCGNYGLHTVMGLLRRECGRGYSEPMRPLFRLDRTTTGLLMFAKNEEFDVKFKELIKSHQLKKEYLCKVEGKFPEGEVICDAKIGLLSHHFGIRCIRSDGQESLSRFRRLHFCPEENTSLLRCQIETGRTHQIRVHLQYLGHPIVGDTMYNDEAWGPSRGMEANYGGRTLEQLAIDICKRHSKTEWIMEQDQDYEERLRRIGEDELYEHREEHDLKNLDEELSTMPDWDEICWECAIRKKRTLHEKGTWMLPLHCWRYSGDGWSYEAPLPDWAKAMNIGHERVVEGQKETADLENQLKVKA